MNYTNHIYRWKSVEGRTLFGQSWIPGRSPKAVINFVHGIGEHTDRYHNWMPFFTENGFAVFAIEYRGHGRSFGKRGSIRKYDDILNDIDVLFQESRKAYPNIPHFLYGHSLGGNIVINYTLLRRPKIQALVATSPWLLLAKEPNRLLIKLALFVRKIFPEWTLNTPIKGNQITQNKSISEGYSKDSLIHKKISFELFTSAYEKGKQAIENAKQMPVPFLLMHGSKDTITSPKGSEAFYENNPKQTELKIWDDMLHELHNESVRESVAEFIVSFLNKHI